MNFDLIKKRLINLTFMFMLNLLFFFYRRKKNFKSSNLKKKKIRKFLQWLTKYDMFPFFVLSLIFIGNYQGLAFLNYLVRAQYLKKKYQQINHFLIATKFLFIASKNTTEVRIAYLRSKQIYNTNVPPSKVHDPLS